MKGGETHGRGVGIPKPCGASELLGGARAPGGVGVSADIKQPHMREPT